MCFAYPESISLIGRFDHDKQNGELKQSEKNLSLVYTTILESHLEFSTILKNSPEENMNNKFEFMQIRRNGN